MRDSRPGVAGRPGQHPIDQQLTRYLRRQPGSSRRGVPGPIKSPPRRSQESRNTALKRYLAARARGHAGAAQVLKQRSPAPEIGPRKIADKILEAMIGQNVGQTTGAWRHPGRGGGTMEFQPPFGRFGGGGKAIPKTGGGLLSDAEIARMTEKMKMARKSSRRGLRGSQAEGDNWVEPIKYGSIAAGVGGSLLYRAKGYGTPHNAGDGDFMRSLDQEGETRLGYIQDVQRLVKTKQISPGRAPQAVDWAHKAGLGAVRAGRKSLRQKYNLPPLGKNHH
jgi:hypothetical protein